MVYSGSDWIGDTHQCRFKCLAGWQEAALWKLQRHSQGTLCSCMQDQLCHSYQTRVLESDGNNDVNEISGMGVR